MIPTAGYRRVAVDCRFAEHGFDTRLRPRPWLRPGDPNCEEQNRDGNYRVRRRQRERCALTDIGIRYWACLPELFDWPADRDGRPCPFSDVYQLVRKALAVTVTAGGLDPGSGHVPVVCDARNLGVRLRAAGRRVSTRQ